jgi:hypothetical protein
MLFYTLSRHDNLSFLNETTQEFSSVPLFYSFVQFCEDLQGSKTNCLQGTFTYHYKSLVQSTIKPF